MVGFILCRLAFNGAVQKWGARWDVRGIDDPAGFPLFGPDFRDLHFSAHANYKHVTRVTEREADAFGINTWREPDGMAMVTLKWSISKARSRADRGIHLFRSSKRPRANPNGDGLESRAFAGGRVPIDCEILRPNASPKLFSRLTTRHGHRREHERFARPLPRSCLVANPVERLPIRFNRLISFARSVCLRSLQASPQQRCRQLSALRFFLRQFLFRRRQSHRRDPFVSRAAPSFRR